MEHDKLSIVVYSCWKNRDMWSVFSALFRKYWPDCPYKVILITDTYRDTGCKYVFKDVIQIDDTWGKMVKYAIRKIGTPYIMLWMDDYLLCDYVKNDEISKYLKKIEKYHAANLRLVESPKCDSIFSKDTKLGYYKLGKAYSVSTQIGIWDAELLYSVIDDMWSAWDFELIGSLRKHFRNHPLLVALDYVFPYEEGVRRGKWMEAGVKLCKRNDIMLDANIRPVMSNRDMAMVYIKGAILDMNPTMIVKIQNFIIGLKRLYTK